MCVARRAGIIYTCSTLAQLASGSLFDDLSSLSEILDTVKSSDDSATCKMSSNALTT